MVGVAVLNGQPTRPQAASVEVWEAGAVVLCGAELRNATIGGRHCRRSDDPRNVKQQSGWRDFLFRVAHVMMPGVYWFWSRRDRWALYIGNPTAQVPASAGLYRWNHPRRAPAPMRTPSRPTGWSLLLSRALPLLVLDAPTAHIPRRLSSACHAQARGCLSFSHAPNRRIYRRLCTLVP